MCRKNIIFLLWLIPVCFSVTIPATGPGGYEDLVVAINENFNSTEAELAFLEKVKTLMTSASLSLFTATNNTFYFKTVKILIPSTWTGTSYSTTRAVDESFATADVRVFKFLKETTENPEEYTAPYTHRSKYCGAQGEYIYLSPQYITKQNEQKNPGKAFVHEWAMYRWGLFEEYGRNRDGNGASPTRFPYLEATSENTTDWKVTRCSDSKIEGTYVAHDYDNGKPFINGSCTKYIVDLGFCRFVPSNGSQTAKSSLLYLPTLDSVTDFCDAAHDKSSKNRQNYFCNERSAWDVIKSHSDYSGRTNLTSFPGNTTFTVVKPAFRVPAIYVLIDTSTGNLGSTVFPTIKTKLSNWVSTSLPKTAVVGLGEFGGTATAQNGLPFGYIVNKFRPAPVGSISGQFSTAINGMSQSRPLGILVDKAIGDAAVLLTPHFWQEGSILMLIKLTTGSPTSESVRTTFPEGPVIDFLTSRKARLYSLEYSVSSEATSNLAGVAKASLGKSYFGGGNANAFSAELDTMLVDIKAITESGFPDVNRIVEIGHKNFNVAAGASYESNFQMHISTSPSVDFQFYVTSGASVTISMVSKGISYPPVKNSGTSWNLGKWDSYSASFTDKTQTGRASWCYKIVNTGAEPVTVHAIAHQLRAKNPPELGSADTREAEIHEFELWATENNGEVTISNSPYRPFGIYAHFFKGLGIVTGLEVYATVTRPDGTSAKIRLYDEKPAGLLHYDIDIEDNDGVYSNIFTPTSPGVHHISVEAASPRAANCSGLKFAEYFAEDGEGRAISPRGLLLPDQYDLYPPFTPISAPNAYFQRYFPYFKSVNVAYTSFVGIPPRILVLTAELKSSNADVQMTFHEPLIYEGARQPDMYTIRYSSDRRNLIRSDGSLSLTSTTSTEVIVDDNSSLTFGSSGQLRNVSFKLMNYAGAETVYFVMASKLTAPIVRYGPPSPIVSVKREITSTSQVSTSTRATTMAASTTTNQKTNITSTAATTATATATTAATATMITTAATTNTVITVSTTSASNIAVPVFLYIILGCFII